VDPNISLNGVLRENLDCGVAVADSQGRLSFINAVARRLLWMDASTQTDGEMLPGNLWEVIRAALETSVGAATRTVQLPTRDGAMSTVNVNACRLPAGRLGEEVLITLWSFGADGKLEERILHLERLARIGVMSAGLAHELRNAMVALSTMTDLLLEQQPQNDLAQTVRRELDRANSLAVRMLHYSKPHALSRKPVSTHQVLDRALQLASARFKAAGATVTTSLQADPDVVAADEAHMEQMFLNLLINAADAIGREGNIILSTETCREHAAGSTVRIAVRDTGPGIAPEVLPNLFQPFYTTKRHGTGLGLYLAQHIINEHSGTIQVNSSPGEGTCVQVTLPLHANWNTAQSSSAPCPNPAASPS
jgi:signal transduction histidine kinase